MAVSDLVKGEANPRALARPLAGAFLGRSECALEAAERVRDAALSDERDPLCQKLIGSLVGQHGPPPPDGRATGFSYLSRSSPERKDLQTTRLQVLRVVFPIKQYDCRRVGHAVKSQEVGT